jgi:hypothetical protein
MTTATTAPLSGTEHRGQGNRIHFVKNQSMASQKINGAAVATKIHGATTKTCGQCAIQARRTCSRANAPTTTRSMSRKRRLMYWRMVIGADFTGGEARMQRCDFPARRDCDEPVEPSTVPRGGSRVSSPLPITYFYFITTSRKSSTWRPLLMHSASHDVDRNRILSSFLASMTYYNKSAGCDADRRAIRSPVHSDRQQSGTE